MPRYLFIIIALIIAIASALVTNRLADQLKDEERNKIELWAETIAVITSQTIANEEFYATIESFDNKENIKQFVDNAFVNYDTLLTGRVLWGNKTIPVIMTDENGDILTVRNVFPQEKQDNDLEQDSAVIEQEIIDIQKLITDNQALLKNKIEVFSKKHEPIEIRIADDFIQRVYYDDSTVLKQLQIFPYIQLGVIFIFILVAFIALNSTKKAEQNRVWVGLSKETAHQLGTPISSLMAWTEYLKTKDTDRRVVAEIDKDVERLKTIAERFSKIGSAANAEPMDLENGIKKAVDYLSKRISSKVEIESHFPAEPICVSMNGALFGWVMENLIKNAVDAMDGQGTIKISAVKKKRKAVISVSDNGKGIPKSKFEKIFHPGYTTKERGWGLGLSLVRRIIESYHKGRIYVYKSEIGKGTTFRIELRTL